MPSIAERLMRIAESRQPDFIVGARETPYLRRWWLIPRNAFANIYLHHFLRSDEDRALHDHPYANASVILRGRYIEESILAGGVKRRIERKAGDMKLRLPRAAHRLELYPDEEAWTLFLTGTRAARECDAIQTAYPAVKHVEWYVRAPLGPWNDTRGRALSDVIDALRGSALLS